MAWTLPKCSTSSSPSWSFSQKTFSTLGSGHHLRQVTVLTIIRNVPGSWLGVTLGTKMQIIIFSPRSRETYSREKKIFFITRKRISESCQHLWSTSHRPTQAMWFIKLKLFNHKGFIQEEGH